MPTSSKRLYARARAYTEACDYLLLCGEGTDDAVESKEYEALAWKLSKEYNRLNELAKVQEQKEKKRIG